MILPRDTFVRTGSKSACIVLAFLVAASGSFSQPVRKIPITASTSNTVVVTGAITSYAGGVSGEDAMAGVLLVYTDGQQDGTALQARFVNGTSYYDAVPDTVKFTSIGEATILYACGIADVSAYSPNLTGQYNVKVNGTSYAVGPINMVYLDGRSNVRKIPITASTSNTVVVSGVITSYPGGFFGEDPMGGVLLVYTDTQQDGTALQARAVNGTSYYDAVPDTVKFTSIGEATSLYACGLADLTAYAPNLTGQYNVKVNATSYALGPGYVLYIDPLTDAEDPADGGVQAFALFQNYPNPFNPSTRIGFSVAERSPVTLSVHNILGQQVAVLVNSDVDAGAHAVNFDASAIPSGVYFYRLQAGGSVQTRKLTVMK